MKKFWSYVTSVNIIIALIGLNFVLAKMPRMQFDLTENKLYTISQVSRQIVKNLKEVVSVKVFVTTDLPAEIKPIASDLKSILNEFQRINPAKLKVTFLDPIKDSEAKTEATKYGIQPLQFSSVKSDKFEVSNGYFGIAIIYGEKQEVLPVANDVGNIEYFLVSSINKLINDKQPSIAIAEDSYTGSSSKYQYFRKYLSKSYTLTDVNLLDNFEIGDDISSLIILDQSKKISDASIKRIESYVKKGKGMVAFVDRIGVNQNMMTTKYEQTGLEKVFSDMGMKILDKLVVDERATITNFRTQSGSFIVKYPYWPEITSENMGSNIPPLSGITTLTIPWTSPIEISGSAKAIFASSQLSILDDNLTDISPLSKVGITGDKNKYVLAAMNTDKSKVALIGDADMIKDQFVTNNQQNLMFALNLVDYFAQDSTLFAIRSKVLKSSPIRIVSVDTKNLIKAINLGFPLLALMVIYFVSSYIRKKKVARWYELDES